MIKEVIQQENPILRAENTEISVFDEKLQKLIDDMSETMESAELSGIAAPQIAVNKKIFVCENYRRLSEGETEPVTERYVFINPKIVSFSESIEEWHEGCGSVQHGQVFGIVERPKRVTIEAQNEKGELFKTKADGFLARVMQHEFDHLNGILFTDKVKPGSKLLSKEEYLELRRKEAEIKKADKSA